MEKSQASVARPSSRRFWWWVGGVVAALVLVWAGGLCLLLGLSSGGGIDRSSWGDDAVAVIYIEGSIGVSSPTAGATVDTDAVIEYVRVAESNRRVKAIVAFINSPGGTVVPSDLMYRALRDAQKPVVAAMGEVAASGGYYVACGADRIVAHPASLTGSIGVYSQVINAAELLDKVGVESIIIRSGDVKAFGNLFEHPTEEQLAIQQSMVEDLHDQFVQVVAKGREMDVAAVRALADGRPFTGEQAYENGLVDELGTLSDAIAFAAEMGGIDGPPDVIEYRRAPSLVEVWLGARQSQGGEAALLEWLSTQFPIPQARYTRP